MEMEVSFDKKELLQLIKVIEFVYNQDYQYIFRGFPFQDFLFQFREAVRVIDLCEADRLRRCGKIVDMLYPEEKVL